jgi:hypothetical protein
MEKKKVILIKEVDVGIKRENVGRRRLIERERERERERCETEGQRGR